MIAGLTPNAVRPKFVHRLRRKVRTAIDAPPSSFQLVSVQDSHPTSTSDSPAACRRAQIYAINSLCRQRSVAEWQAYQQKRRRQMAALEMCFEHARPMWESVGLRRWAERCRWVQEHERHQVALAAERAQSTLAYCITITATSDDDAAMLHAMPVDECCGRQQTRYCPWYSTAAGCPRLSSCPLSHNELPQEQVTWAYRRWALEAHDGWIGEPMNKKYARIHAL